MAERSQALPLTDSCVSPLPRFQIPAGTCKKVTSHLGLGGGFHQVLWFTLVSRNSVAEKEMKIEIPY